MMKTQIGTLQATPSRRLFLSIIADYDLNRSVCELIDNGLDVWVRTKRAKPISIRLTLDRDQQRIRVQDDADGLPKSELGYIVGPGQTGSAATDETIGIFGVGTERAVVALAQDIRITTRHGKAKTHHVEFDDQWLGDEDWALPLYVLTEESVDLLRDHLCATYAKFLLNDDVTIELDGMPLKPVFFDNWAYPPDYEPRRYTGEVEAEDGRLVRGEATAGLSDESSPASGEYGVYFYCNDVWSPVRSRRSTSASCGATLACPIRRCRSPR